MKPTTHDAYKLLHDGALTLSKIESNGIRVDIPYLNNAILEVEGKIKDLEKYLTFFRLR